MNVSTGAANFAATLYIACELDKRFTDIGQQDGLSGLSQDVFFAKLGNHINELNAIHPFREGNGRTMRHHAAQLAREAGYPIRIAAIDRDKWLEASRHGFHTGDHRALTGVLSAAALRRDAAPEPRTGFAGIAMLPTRTPPSGKRYRVTLPKVREEFARYLPAAREQAADRLRTLITEGAESFTIAKARAELAYVRHAKGPMYQAHLLTYLGVRQVDAVITAEQTPFERVREIGAALGVQIKVQPPVRLQRAIRELEKPLLPPNHPFDHERLAAAFLKNTREANRADPNLALAQAIVDAAMQTARDRGESGRMVEAIKESTRQLVVDRLRTGRTPESENNSAAPTPPSRDRGRNR